MASSYRIKAELKNFFENPPDCMVLDAEKTAEDTHTWFINVEAAKETIYEGEKYVLRVRFGDDYPFKPPEVVFVGDCVPCNPHVYECGHICISTLGDGWSPMLNVQAVCVSIISMLASCKTKQWPVDNSNYSKRMAGKSPDYKHFNGTYWDAKC